jgi:uncharacterized protein
MLQNFADWVIYDIMHLDSATQLAQSLNFFVYDSIKILLFLFIMIFIVSYFRTYISNEKIRKYLKKSRFGSGNFIAAGLGAITPFCSCSSIPVFMGLVGAGVPLGITFSFLVTSPLVNEYVIILMLGFFGWKITALYILSGILIGVFSGMILGKMKLEKHLVSDIVSKQKDSKYENVKQRLNYALSEAKSIVRKLWIWILVGIGIAAFIHNYIPQEFIEGVISKTGILAVPFAVVLGIPMYANSVAIIPIAVALFEKGAPLGTALAFMMAAAALSLPEAIILRRVLKLKLILIFFAVVALAIIITGYLFNLLTFA